VKGTWTEGFLAGDPEGYVEALEIGISFHRGPIWGTWRRAPVPGTLRYGWKGLWRCGVSLCGSSVKGTWREGFLAGDPEEYVEKALETGISFHRGPIWGTWGGLIYWGL